MFTADLFLLESEYDPYITLDFFPAKSFLSPMVFTFWENFVPLACPRF